MTDQSPIILALETSTSACSAALQVNGNITTRFEVGSNVHSRVLLSMLDSLLQEAGIAVQQLDAVAVGQGPGSFTGLRIGVGVGQGVAFGAACPMIAVPSLDALAQSASIENGHVLAGIDARMGEIYWASYVVSEGTIAREGCMRVSAPGDIELETDKVSLVGNAWEAYRESLTESVTSYGTLIHDAEFPKAEQVLFIANQKFALNDCCMAVDFAPIYVRDDVAKKSSKPLPGNRPPTG